MADTCPNCGYEILPEFKVCKNCEDENQWAGNRPYWYDQEEDHGDVATNPTAYIFSARQPIDEKNQVDIPYYLYNEIDENRNAPLNIDYYDRPVPMAIGLMQDGFLDEEIAQKLRDRGVYEPDIPKIIEAAQKALDAQKNIGLFNQRQRQAARPKPQDNNGFNVEPQLNLGDEFGKTDLHILTELAYQTRYTYGFGRPTSDPQKGYERLISFIQGDYTQDEMPTFDQWWIAWKEAEQVRYNESVLGTQTIFSKVAARPGPGDSQRNMLDPYMRELVSLENSSVPYHLCNDFIAQGKTKQEAWDYHKDAGGDTADPQLFEHFWNMAQRLYDLYQWENVFKSRKADYGMDNFPADYEESPKFTEDPMYNGLNIAQPGFNAMPPEHQEKWKKILPWLFTEDESGPEYMTDQNVNTYTSSNEEDDDDIQFIRGIGDDEVIQGKPLDDGGNLFQYVPPERSYSLEEALQDLRDGGYFWKIVPTETPNQWEIQSKDKGTQWDKGIESHLISTRDLALRGYDIYYQDPSTPNGTMMPGYYIQDSLEEPKGRIWATQKVDENWQQPEPGVLNEQHMRENRPDFWQKHWGTKESARPPMQEDEYGHPTQRDLGWEAERAMHQMEQPPYGAVALYLVRLGFVDKDEAYAMTLPPNFGLDRKATPEEWDIAWQYAEQFNTAENSFKVFEAARPPQDPAQIDIKRDLNYRVNVDGYHKFKDLQSWPFIRNIAEIGGDTKEEAWTWMQENIPTYLIIDRITPELFDELWNIAQINSEWSNWPRQSNEDWRQEYQYRIVPDVNKKRCETCSAFREGKCKMFYDDPVTENGYCTEWSQTWEPKNSARPKIPRNRYENPSLKDEISAQINEINNSLDSEVREWLDGWPEEQKEKLFQDIFRYTDGEVSREEFEDWWVKVKKIEQLSDEWEKLEQIEWPEMYGRYGARPDPNKEQMIIPDEFTSQMRELAEQYHYMVEVFNIVQQDSDDMQFAYEIFNTNYPGKLSYSDFNKTYAAYIQYKTLALKRNKFRLSSPFDNKKGARPIGDPDQMFPELMPVDNWLKLKGELWNKPYVQDAWRAIRDAQYPDPEMKKIEYQDLLKQNFEITPEEWDEAWEIASQLYELEHNRGLTRDMRMLSSTQCNCGSTQCAEVEGQYYCTNCLSPWKYDEGDLSSDRPAAQQQQYNINTLSARPSEPPQNNSLNMSTEWQPLQEATDWNREQWWNDFWAYIEESKYQNDTGDRGPNPYPESPAYICPNCEKVYDGDVPDYNEICPNCGEKLWDFSDYANDAAEDARQQDFRDSYDDSQYDPPDYGPDRMTWADVDRYGRIAARPKIEDEDQYPYSDTSQTSLTDFFNWGLQEVDPRQDESDYTEERYEPDYMCPSCYKAYIETGSYTPPWKNTIRKCLNCGTNLIFWDNSFYHLPQFTSARPNPEGQVSLDPGKNLRIYRTPYSELIYSYMEMGYDRDDGYEALVSSSSPVYLTKEEWDAAWEAQMLWLERFQQSKDWQNRQTNNVADTDSPSRYINVQKEDLGERTDQNLDWLREHDLCRHCEVNKAGLTGYCPECNEGRKQFITISSEEDPDENYDVWEEENEDGEQYEPDEWDAIISTVGRGAVDIKFNGKWIHSISYRYGNEDFDDILEEAYKYIACKMDIEGYYPNVWLCDSQGCTEVLLTKELDAIQPKFQVGEIVEEEYSTGGIGWGAEIEPNFKGRGYNPEQMGFLNTYGDAVIVAVNRHTDYEYYYTIQEPDGTITDSVPEEYIQKKQRVAKVADILQNDISDANTYTTDLHTFTDPTLPDLRHRDNDQIDDIEEFIDDQGNVHFVYTDGRIYWGRSVDDIISRNLLHTMTTYTQAALSGIINIQTGQVIYDESTEINQTPELKDSFLFALRRTLNTYVPEGWYQPNDDILHSDEEIYRISY